MWGISANVVRERRAGTGGKEIKRGTSQFHTGAKVYIAYPHEDAMTVVGHLRGGRYTASTIRLEYLENFRPELIYSPTVIEQIKANGTYWLARLDGSDEAKQTVTEVAANLANRAKRIADQKEGKWAAQAVIETLFASCGGVFHAHGKSAQFTHIDKIESAERVLMRIFLWALYLPQYPDLQAEAVASRQHYVVQVGAAASGEPKPVFMGTSEQIYDNHTINWVEHCPSTHLAIAGWHYPFALYREWVEYMLTVRRLRRTAPIDLIRIPDDAARFIDPAGNVAISFDDVEWVRLENQLGGQ